MATKSNIEKTLDKNIEAIKNKLGEPIPNYYLKEKLVENIKTRRIYLLWGIIFFSLIIIDVLTFFTKNILAIVLVMVFSVIFYIIIFIVFLARLIIFRDFERLRNKIVMKTGDYIRVYFFRTGKRISEKIIIPEEDGKTFKFNGIYTIDESETRLNNRGEPVGFWLYGIPNQLDFDFLNYLGKYFENIKKGKPEENEKLNLDVRYSSKTLELLKNDKLMEDMHKDYSPEVAKYFGVIVTLVIIFAIIIFIMFLFLNKTPTIIVNPVNVTGV